MKKLVIVYLLFGSSQYAIASDWAYFGGSRGTSHRIDLSSLGSVGKYRKAWIETNYGEQPQTSSKILRFYKSERSLYFFDCRAKLISSVQTIRYADLKGLGDVIESSSVKFSPGNLVDVVPDSVGEQSLVLACADQRALEHIRSALPAEETNLSESSVSASPKVKGSQKLYEGLSDEEIMRMLMKK